MVIVRCVAAAPSVAEALVPAVAPLFFVLRHIGYGGDRGSSNNYPSRGRDGSQLIIQAVAVMAVAVMVHRCWLPCCLSATCRLYSRWRGVGIDGNELCMCLWRFGGVCGIGGYDHRCCGTGCRGCWLEVGLFLMQPLA